ncbi:MAG: glycerate kinase, partial [Myxococcales bacterium]|nr:glycerate kinase [Myxococcales bacterium]
ELTARGLRARVLAPSQASVEALAHEYIELARHLRPGRALVRAAEPSLELPERAGKGGRSTHLGALVGLELPRGAMFLAAATDGVDGASGTAGAVVGAAFLRKVGAAAVRRALDHYDTGALHLAAGTALPSRPSGHNLADLHVLVMR